MVEQTVASRAPRSSSRRQATRTRTVNLSTWPVGVTPCRRLDDPKKTQPVGVTPCRCCQHSTTKTCKNSSEWKLITSLLDKRKQGLTKKRMAAQEKRRVRNLHYTTGPQTRASSRRRATNGSLADLPPHSGSRAQGLDASGKERFRKSCTSTRPPTPRLPARMTRHLVK